ncbi:MAG: oligosaccharide flippase family protein [Acetobacteraceae bacterium]|nr:oligosaccharide flippase family protein [Acetobacteraceae bacterium]
MQSLSSRVAQLGGQLVTASLLSPREFGQIGLAYTVATIGMALVDTGLDQVLVQRQRTVQVWVAPALGLTAVSGILGVFILLVAAPIAAAAYREPAITGLVSILAVALPINAVSTIPSVLLKSAFRFETLAVIASGEILAIQVLTIGLILIGLGVYSFALPVPLLALIRTTVMWRVARPKISGDWQLRRWKYLIGNSVNVSAARLITSAISQGDYTILGLMASSAVVGNYFFAFRLASQPLFMLAGNLSNVLLPTLSSLRGNLNAQAEAALTAAKLLGLIIMPLAFLEAALAEPALHLLFGVKWEAAVPLIQILSVSLAFDSIAWVAGALLLARGNFRATLVYMIAISPFFFVFVAIGGYIGSAIGVACGVGLYYIGLSPVYAYCVFRQHGISPSRLASLYLGPAALAATAIGISLIVRLIVPVSSDIGRICLIISVATAAYAGLLRWIEPTSYHQLLSKMIGMIRDHGWLMSGTNPGTVNGTE